MAEIDAGADSADTEPSAVVWRATVSQPLEWLETEEPTDPEKRAEMSRMYEEIFGEPYDGTGSGDTSPDADSSSVLPEEHWLKNSW